MQPYKSKIKTGKKKSIARGAKGTKAKGLPRVAPKKPYYVPTEKSLSRNRSNGVGVGK